MSAIQGLVACLVILGCLATPVLAKSPDLDSWNGCHTPGSFLESCMPMCDSRFDPGERFETLLTAGRWSEAETSARTMVTQDPSSPTGWYFLGRTLFERGCPADLKGAVSHLSQAVSLEPGFAPAWFWLGRASGQLAGGGSLMKRINLAGQAREAFAKALELDPENFEYAYALVQFYLRAPAMVGGSREGAQEVILRFKGKRPAERLLLKASFALADIDDAEVLTLLSEVGDMEDRLIRRTWEEIAFHLGRRQLSKQWWDAAVTTFRLVIERLPDLPVGYLELGRALEGNGRIDEAREAYRRAAELAPDRPVAEARKVSLEATPKSNPVED